MHGRVKVRTTAEQELIKKAEKKKKAAEFKKALQLIFQKRKNNEFDYELLKVIEKILIQHPDVYTLWNIRRESFSANELSELEKVNRLEKELTITELCLRENPKSYCIWHHRMWSIGQLSKPNWKRELELCNKCLDLDERNFHCWDYRQFVVSKSTISNADELKYTADKIASNFSNYSSWHYRSKLLVKMYPSCDNNLPIKDDIHDEELDLVMNATFTDPNDSSSWFYYRWLLNYWKAPSQLWKAEIFDGSLIAVFHSDVSSNLQFILNDKYVPCDWKNNKGKTFSPVWYTKVTFSEKEDIRTMSLRFENNIYEFELQETKRWICKGMKVHKINSNPKLVEQLNNYRCLTELEPLNKWSRFMIVNLMMNINLVENINEIISEIDKLMEVDSLRKNYYKDLRSKCILEYKLYEKEKMTQETLELSNLQLTSIAGREHYFTFYKEIDLSDNNLLNKLYQFWTFNCAKLNLSNNSISSLDSFPCVPKLKILLLSKNQIKSFDEVLDLLKKNPQLEKIDLSENSFSVSDDSIHEAKCIYPNLQLDY